MTDKERKDYEAGKTVNMIGFQSASRGVVLDKLTSMANLSKGKIDEDVVTEIAMMEKYPGITNKGRKLYSESDTPEYTSIETYLRGELLSYSEKTLQLYLKYILEMKEKDINLAIKNMDNLANMQGFKNSDEVEEYYKNLQKN